MVWPESKIGTDLEKVDLLLDNEEIQDSFSAKTHEDERLKLSATGCQVCEILSFVTLSCYKRGEGKDSKSM
jgi:hypothetical protein